MLKRYRYLIILFIAVISIQAVNVNKDKLYEIAKNIEIFTNVYKELNTNYVDEIDPSELMRTGIDAMVNSLDPYTNYISESQIESFRISTEGKYSGIGAVIREVDSVLTVIEAYETSPAIKAGLIPGDRIISLNGEKTKGRSSDDVRNIMRGAPGTDVELEIERYGESALRKVIVNRSEINIPNVPHSEVLDGGIAYVHLSKFTANAGSNIRKAILKMKSENDLKGVILDLRNNGGGLLREAIAVTNIFVPKDEEIVSTKGKVFERDRIYKTTTNPLDTAISLVVLINKRSASASEIVSGAIQDFDRGVLLGQKSFGKGLVQNTKKVGYNSQVKLTTSKYYIPSGRCIQSVAYENGEPVDIPDEDRKKFKTKNGREVLDGGGVKPDYKIEKEELPDFVKFLLMKNVIFKYVNDFYSRHDSIEDVSTFSFNDYDSFIAYYNTLGLSYSSKVRKEFDSFMKELNKEDTDLAERLEADLSAQINTDISALFQTNKEEILAEIEKEIVSRYYFINGKIRYSLRNDKELNEAKELLNNYEQYKNILNGTSE